MRCTQFLVLNSKIASFQCASLYALYRPCNSLCVVVVAVDVVRGFFLQQFFFSNCASQMQCFGFFHLDFACLLAVRERVFCVNLLLVSIKLEMWNVNANGI